MLCGNQWDPRTYTHTHTHIRTKRGEGTENRHREEAITLSSSPSSPLPRRERVHRLPTNQPTNHRNISLHSGLSHPPYRGDQKTTSRWMLGERQRGKKTVGRKKERKRRRERETVTQRRKIRLEISSGAHCWPFVSRSQGTRNTRISRNNARASSNAVEEGPGKGVGRRGEKKGGHRWRGRGGRETRNTGMDSRRGERGCK